MVPARADLVRGLDAKKAPSGAAVEAKLTQKVTLTNGTELPNGTILVGQVAEDDLQQQGAAKLALRFNQARLKNGTAVPIKATIVGFYSPVDKESDPEGGGPSDEIANTWTAATLQVDQPNVTRGVDLHSKIGSDSSGVFVSTKKDDVKLDAGSEIQLAIAPAS